MTNQAPQPAPSGLGAVLPIVQAVVAIVPRWLVVAAGVIFLSFWGVDLYFSIQTKALDLQAKQAETKAKTATYNSPSAQTTSDASTSTTAGVPRLPNGDIDIMAIPRRKPAQ